MNEKYKLELKGLEVSLGMICGYLIAGSINKFANDIPWSVALSSKELIYSFAGIAISIFILYGIKRKIARK